MSKAAKDMSSGDVEDFAKTKHDGLPEKIDESTILEGWDLDKAYEQINWVVKQVSENMGNIPKERLRKTDYANAAQFLTGLRVLRELVHHLKNRSASFYEYYRHHDGAIHIQNMLKVGGAAAMTAKVVAAAIESTKEFAESIQEDTDVMAQVGAHVEEKSEEFQKKALQYIDTVKQLDPETNSALNSFTQVATFIYNKVKAHPVNAYDQYERHFNNFLELGEQAIQTVGQSQHESARGLTAIITKMISLLGEIQSISNDLTQEG